MALLLLGPVACSDLDQQEALQAPHTGDARAEQHALDVDVLFDPAASGVHVVDIDVVAPTPDGGVVILDARQSQVERFARDGRHIGRIGARGRGPGEFDGAWGLAVDPAGRVTVATVTNELVVYDTDGTHRGQVRAPGRLYHGDPVRANADGTLNVGIVATPSSPGRPPRITYVRLGSDGRVLDSVPVQPTPWDGEVGLGQADITPHWAAAWSPRGFVVSGVSSRLALQYQMTNGEVRTVERDVDPVAYLPDERRDWELQNQFLRARSGQADRFPDVGEHKPYFREIVTAQTGEVWVVRNARSVGGEMSQPGSVMGVRPTPRWEQPFLADVFDEGGRYLRTVHGPPRVRIHAVAADTAWGVLRDGAFGLPRVARFVVVLR